MKTITALFLFIISLTVSGQVIEGKLLELEFNGGSNPKNITPGVNKLYLSAENGYSGRELYVYDKILDSIQQVKDIVPGSQGSIANNEESFICIGDELYFVALKQLWKSDGTEAGTIMIKDINPSGESHIRNFTIFNGILYFTAYDNTNLYRLWRSDGTTAGTYFLNIPQGPNGTQIYNLTVFNNHLYFIANDGVNGYELWQSNGTANGTIPLTNLNGNLNGLSVNTSFLEFNNYMYFFANDGVHGSELWRTDGTIAGTQLFKDINPGTQSSSFVFNGVATDNYFVFMASVPFSSNNEPWVSDGTAAGTQLLKNIHPTASSITATTRFVAFNNNVFFIANDGVHGNELWKTDGTEAGTQLFIDFIPGTGGNSVYELTATTDFLIFAAHSQGNSYRTLWKSDGTVAGTHELHDVDLYQTSATNLQFVEFQDAVYFQAGYESDTGMELWSTDGTPANTSLFRDIRRERGISPVHFSVLDNKLVFVGSSSTYGQELYISDGTNQGSNLIKDINQGGSGSMYMGTNTDKSFINVNDIVYFRATEPTHGREIYRTDGTEQGTYLLKDIASGSAHSQNNETFFASLGNLLFFKANDQIHGNEMWVSDGTETGTKMLKDINPGSGTGFNISNIKKHYDGYAVLNGELYFSAFDGNQYWIWKTDGTEAGTVPVIHIPSSGPSDGGPLIFGGDNNKFYFGTNHNNTTLARVNQVWVTDGTQQNSSIVYTGAHSPIRETYVFNGDLYFSASASGIGRTLHKSDGTAQGTIVLSNTISLTQHLQEFNFGFFLECSGYLFFYTYNTNQLWRTDGTTQGTALFGDFLYPNPHLSDMVCFQDLVFYIEGFRAKSIKVTDGSTINLDFPIELINNPLLGQYEGIDRLAVTNSNLFFSANTQNEGTELYLARGGTILPCNAPTALTLDWFTSTTADISWTASATETGGYNWLLMEDGDDPLIDVPVASGSVGTGITTVELTGLVDNTTYDFYVQTQCAGNESTWAGPLNFTTHVFVCSPPTALTIVNVTDTKAEISWTASTVETGGYAWYVFADGDDPLSDPSLFNGTVATGITTVTVSGLTAATDFDVYVSTLCIAGLESTLAGPLNVLTDAAPVNDECTGAIMLTVGTDFADQQVVGNNENATNNPTDPIPDCANANFTTHGKDVWYTVVVPPSGYITVETRSNGDAGMTDTGLQIYSGLCGAIASVECNDDDGIGNFSKIELSGQTPGQTLLVRVWGYDTNEGEFLVSAFDDFAPAVFPAPYCGPIVFTDPVQPITNVDVAGISNRSSNVIGGSPYHEDFTLVMGTMEQGGTYTIALEGNTNGNWVNRFAVFIDWNQNDVLDDANEVFQITQTITNSTGMDGQQAIGTITVPANAVLGQTRMRVKKIYSFSNYLNPCLGTNFGQVEDYTIEVIPAGATDCDVPTNLTLTNATATTANFSWTPSPDEIGGYSWVVMLMGDDPNTDPPAYQGTEASGVTSAMATGLTPETMYHAYVKTICDPGVESDFSSLLQFTTEQPMSVHDNEMNQLSYFPNPTTGILTLDARNVIESVEVFTLNGQKVLLNQENKQSVQLDLSGLAQGVYMLKAYFDDGIVKAFSIIKK